MADVGSLLRHARRQLATASFAPSTREAALLLAHALGLRETQILAYPERPVSPEQAAKVETLVARRRRGEPVAYLIGEREFFGRPFGVDHRVLIPRPETEHLVEAALALALPPTPRIVDVGTGSGCIAWTLALERADATVWALDRSIDALAVARANRRRLAGTREAGASTLAPRTRLVQADLLAPVALTQIDLVVSNPPYVDPAEAASLSHEVTDFEPATALFAAEGGRALIVRLLDATRHLRPGTPTVMEIGYDQGGWLQAAIDERPWLGLERMIDDYGGIPRTAVMRTLSAGAT